MARVLSTHFRRCMMMMPFNCCSADDCQPSCLASLPTLPDEQTVTLAHAKNDNSQLHQRKHVCGKGDLIRGAHAELRRGGGLRRSSCAAASLLAGALDLFAAGSFGRADGAAAVLEAVASDSDSTENRLVISGPFSKKFQSKDFINIYKKNLFRK